MDSVWLKPRDGIGPFFAAIKSIEIAGTSGNVLDCALVIPMSFRYQSHHPFRRAEKFHLYAGRRRCPYQELTIAVRGPSCAEWGIQEGRRRFRVAHCRF